MEEITKLSPARVILLTAQLASTSDIRGLETLIASQPSVLQLELVLRIILTFLPESLDPLAYTPLLESLTSENAIEVPEGAHVDLGAVKELSDQQSSSRASRLHLVRLQDSAARTEAVKDPLTLFLIHRAHRIDKKTGLLTLIPPLVRPFVERSSYLRKWYISVIIPFIRREVEYYPGQDKTISLKDFESLCGSEGVSELLRPAAEQANAYDAVIRDLRGIVGPWIQGSLLRDASAGEYTRPNEISAAIKDWQHIFEWLVSRSINDIALTAEVIAEWTGPEDIDLDGLEDPQEKQQEDTAAMYHHLRSRYSQAGLAAVYAAEDDSEKGLQHAYRIVSRVSELAGFDPLPMLTSDPSLLPIYGRIPLPLNELPKDCLYFEKLLDADGVLTNVSDETYTLVQWFLHSANLLRSIGHPISISKVAKLRFWGDESEQYRLLQKLMHSFNMGPKKDESDWLRVRNVLLWLKSWGIQQEDEQNHGILGKLSEDVIEREMLQALCLGGQYQLAAQMYTGTSAPLPRKDVEKTLVDLVLNFYDNASNGNRTRGGVGKASEVITTFKKALQPSPLLDRFAALIAATHALSFYSLTLVPGTPLQPRSIREYGDPVDLISKVLDQNAHSYTKLDDFVSIGRNLVVALDGDPTFQSTEPTPKDVEAMRASRTERRVTGLAVEAALAENDFETAYSYVVNRLPSPDLSNEKSVADEANNDDESWRAAFHAGRHRGSAPSKRTSTSSPEGRRLEQRMELLSTAMLLAPSSALPEILGAWRRCEEELLALLALETKAETEFDDQADAGEIRAPGAFGGEPTFMVQPKRKEIGRGAAEEAPMGLFEVARGAAAAFGRTAGGAVTKTRPSNQHQAQNSLAAPTDDEEGRVRRRDVVANAITGGLVSGVGWVLGAKPAGQE